MKSDSKKGLRISVRGVVKHKFQNPTIKRIVRHLIEMDKSEFQTVKEFMEDIGVVMEPTSYARFVDLAMRESARQDVPVREGPKFRADVLDKVARGSV